MRDRIIAGDTLDFVTTFPDYPAATWTCTYYFTPRTAGSGAAFSVVCAAGTGPFDHRCGAAAATTAGWVPAEYGWQARMVNGSEVRSGDRWPWRGECTVLPNPATATSYDGRSPARIALDAINAALATHAEKAHIVEYEIGGRRMKFADQGALLVMRQRLAAEVAAEEVREKLAAGLGGGRKLQVRL